MSRPFGVALLMAGFDEKGAQLFFSDPSGKISTGHTPHPTIDPAPIQYHCASPLPNPNVDDSTNPDHPVWIY